MQTNTCQSCFKQTNKTINLGLLLGKTEVCEDCAEKLDNLFWNVEDNADKLDGKLV